MTTGLASGSLGQALRAGFITAATAVAMYGVGELTMHQPAFGKPMHAANIAGHAAVGCASSVASGGKCGPGALSGAIGSFAAPLLRGLSYEAGLIAHSTIGGLASVAGGGKFGNGAVTAAFGYLFNDLACNQKTQTCWGNKPTKDEIDRHYNDGTGWTVYAGEMDPSWLDGSQFRNIPVGTEGRITTNPLSFFNLTDSGDMTIYGNFMAFRLDQDSFLWRDRYSFEMHPWLDSFGSALRNIITGYGEQATRTSRYVKYSTPREFDIIGISPVRIPK